MSLDAQRRLSIGVTVALAVIGAIQLGNPDVLGITPRISAWLGILAVGLGILAGFLPRVQGPTTDPEVLIERISDLPREDRIRVAETLAYRAEQEGMP